MITNKVMMNYITSGSIGIIHLIFSITAMVSGLYVLLSTKGNIIHKKIGYIYTFSMVIVNITALGIYELYGKFGVFHWFAVLSIITLLAGLYPIIVKKSKNYIQIHLNFMYWSVVGLYCAFMAEIFSRLPKIVLTEKGEPMFVFYKGVGIGIGIVMTFAIFFYFKFYTKWLIKYDKK